MVALLLLVYQVVFFVLVDGVKAFRTIGDRLPSDPLQMSLQEPLQ